MRYPEHKLVPFSSLATSLFLLFVLDVLRRQLGKPLERGEFFTCCRAFSLTSEAGRGKFGLVVRKTPNIIVTPTSSWGNWFPFAQLNSIIYICMVASHARYNILELGGLLFYSLYHRTFKLIITLLQWGVSSWDLTKKWENGRTGGRRGLYRQFGLTHVRNDDSLRPSSFATLGKADYEIIIFMV